jgi:pyruvate dehydrogenase (quinone)
VERSADIDSAVRTAFAADRPVIIDALTDPEEPPLPPHITVKQARSFASALLKDPSGGLAGAMEAFREKVDEFVPGR